MTKVAGIHTIKADSNYRTAVKDMTRLGQCDLTLLMRRVGTMWVRHLEADRAFQPRILLSAGCQVHELAARQQNEKDLTGFTIATLGGQLRWGDADGPVIGDLSFPKKLEHLRSGPHSFEHQFTMSCDVPLQVLSRLEAERAGKAVCLWIDLAGSWAIDGGFEPIFIHPWQITVPAEMWDSLLSGVRYAEFDILEIRRVTLDGGHLRGATAHLLIAREKMTSDPTGAVGQCRYVIEALQSALQKNGGQEKEGIANYLTKCIDNKRGKEYNKIVAAIKQLAALPHHEYGSDIQFTYPEALALVRICEAILGLMSELPSPREF